ncbi:MAG: BphX family protein [Ignavibacteriaceae bacterium]
MKKLQWWFRLVGGFYLILTIINLYGIFINKGFLRQNLPFPVGDVGFGVTLDFWFTFVLDLLVMGGFLLWVSWKPLKNLNFVWLVIWLELIRGIADDLYMIARGYHVSFYIVFITIHIIIIVTGFIFAWQASAQLSVSGN